MPPSIAQARLISVVAPAGYGKTVWLEQLLTQGRAESRIYVDFGAADGAMLRDSPDQFIARLTDRLADRTDTTTLVLDSVHLAEPATAHALITALAEAEIPRLRICVASRLPLQLQIAHRYARGDAVQITGEELRFTATEIGRLFAGVLGDDSIARVVELTEGWPAAVQLIFMWLGRQRERPAALADVPLDSTHIAELIEQQVLVGLSDAQRSFLCDVCVLDEIDSEIADSMRADGTSAQLLRELEALRPLIYPAQYSSHTRKLNPLFRRYFEHTLNGDGPAARGLHRLAADRLNSRGDVAGAITHACKAQDFDHAAKLFLAAGGVRFFIKAGVHSFRTLLDLLPEATVNSSPRLHLARVILLMKEGCFTLAREQLDHIRARTQDYAEDWTGEDPVPLRTDAAITETLFRYYCSSLEPQDLPTLTRTVLADPSSDPYLMSVHLANVNLVIEQQCGNLAAAERRATTILRLCRRSRLDFQEAYTHLHLGLIAFARGFLPTALGSYERALNILRDRIPDEHELRSSTQILIAETCFEQAADQAVAIRLHTALDMVEQTEGAFEMYAGGFATAAAQAFSSTGIAAAMDILQRAENKAIERGIENLQTFVDAVRITYLLRAGHHPQACQLAERIDLPRKWPALLMNTNSSWRVRDALGLAAGRYALAAGDTHESGRIADLAAEDMLAGGRTGSLIRARLLQALIALKEGRAADARRIVHDALQIAVPLEYIRPFIDAGEALRDVLENLELAKPELPFVSKIRSALRAQLGLGVLNTREVEVLQGLHAGHSNKEIARDLGLSANTIKYHLRMIFAKLDVRHRNQALVEAHRRGLLSPQGHSARH